MLSTAALVIPWRCAIWYDERDPVEISRAISSLASLEKPSMPAAMCCVPPVLVNMAASYRQRSVLGNSENYTVTMIFLVPGMR